MAGCISKAYHSLPINVTQQMLYFPSQDELFHFISQVIPQILLSSESFRYLLLLFLTLLIHSLFSPFAQHNLPWRVKESDATSLVFSDDRGNMREEVPTMKLISRSIEYAKELERIV
jgi:hypothetical protein